MLSQSFQLLAPMFCEPVLEPGDFVVEAWLPDQMINAGSFRFLQDAEAAFNRAVGHILLSPYYHCCGYQNSHIFLFNQGETVKYVFLEELVDNLYNVVTNNQED